jgi:hypothetical protein
MEEVLRRFLVIETGSTDMPVEARWDSNLEFQETETHIFSDRQPEKILRQARRILRSMVAINAELDRTGRNPIPDN